MAKILVLGATGNIGGYVATHLLEQKASIAVGVRKPTEKAAEALKAKGAEIREFDFDNKDLVAKAVEGIETLFLLPPFTKDIAGPSSVVVDAAKKAGVKFILRVSAAGADSKASLSVAKEHGTADDYLKASGISYAIIRPTFFTVNLLAQANAIQTQSAFYGSSGTGKHTIIAPQDIGRTAAYILLSPDKHKNQEYLLTGSELVNGDDIAATFSAVLRKTVKYVDLPTDAHKGALAKAGLPSWMVDDIAGLEGFKKAEYVTEITQNVKKITGTWPQTFLSWVEENKAAFTETEKAK